MAAAESRTAAAPGMFLFGLIGAMLASGTANTLLMKFQVRTKVAPGIDQTPVGFAHPFTQTLFMLLGETLCLMAWFATRRKPSAEEVKKDVKFNKFIMLVPAIFDLLACTLVHAAYIFIPASTAQMCRGSIVIFTAAMSFIFLGRRQHSFHIGGIVCVAFGITLVAIAGRSSSASTGTKGGILVGVLLCLGAQVFHAVQLVVEERFLGKFPLHPLQAVGLEGFFGVIIVIIALCIMNPLGAENTRAAIYQMGHSAPLTISICCAIVSIACYNAAGITITKHSSCVARATIDCARTISIWIIELALGWNTFKGLQLVGFIFVAVGTLLYNRIVEVRRIFNYPTLGEEEPLAAKKKGAQEA